MKKFMALFLKIIGLFLQNIVHEANLENDRSDFIRPKIEKKLWTKFH